jgi:hypothetical protein
MIYHKKIEAQKADGAPQKTASLHRDTPSSFLPIYTANSTKKVCH